MKRRVSWLEVSRQRVRAANIQQRLVAFVNGEITMTQAQVTAALGLLKKIMPDLTAVEMSGHIEQRNTVSAEPLTEEQWAQQYSTH